MADPSASSVASDRPLRLAAAALAILLAVAAFLLRDTINPRLQAVAGIITFIAIVAAFSQNLRAVSWRTVAWGMALQIGLAVFILKFEVGGFRPGYAFFSKVGGMVKQFLEFTNAGSQFVFGALANPPVVEKGLGPGTGFIFAFSALPTIIFVSSFFTVLYYFGVLQFIVRMFARAMQFALRTSGAETLSAAANVFMGQTEAPIIVKPYVPAMTRSELLAMMVGGMATISGGVMAVYISLGADPVAILTTSVMAAPCGLYLAKILYPETEEPATRGDVKIAVERTHANVIDAASAGASDGTLLAINVAAMLIAFLAFIAFFDYLLALVSPGLSLAGVFAWVFSPVAVLMGVPAQDVAGIGDLLGTKLVANEFVAYVKLTTEYRDVLSDRSYILATYALTGFANFASIGIQLGGIGAMAPSRRGDLARLGSRALLGGFLATLINASIASALL
ncbi:MAG TPA: nucleoside transporter C-terminal domain-containing protein [Vicinamibacterales bacterium]|nr:nucleoside transporter C-terminal domain-containing protein [Vicinamibacterales bacterium]